MHHLLAVFLYILYTLVLVFSGKTFFVSVLFLFRTEYVYFVEFTFFIVICFLMSE